MENKNSRYEIRKYTVAYADTKEEAIKIATGNKADWQEVLEIIDWGEDEVDETN